MALVAMSLCQAGEPAVRPWWAPAAGNMALLVAVDSSQPEERALVDRTLLCALDHFGMPFELLDLAKAELSDKTLLTHPAVVMAQPDLGKRLSDRDISLLEQAVKSGVGLANFDGNLSTYPSAYLRLLGVASAKAARAASLRIAKPSHPITAGSPQTDYQLVQPIEVTDPGHLSDAQVLLQTDQGLPAAFTTRVGKGRIVQFTLPTKLWLPNYFGHVHGLDGVFWKSIVWAARKPFVMLAMPPFVAARIDDASGSGSKFLINGDSAAKSFRYIATLNRFGYRPNVGLFTDDIRDEDAPIIREKFDHGLAEFSAHAWTEGRFIYLDRIRDRQETRMVEFTPEDLEQRFAKLDGQFAKWGVRPSKTLNCHCFNPGTNSLPFLKQRGETFMMFAGEFGKDYYDPSAFTWHPKPYGDPGLTLDYMPGHPDFFNVMAHPYKVSREGRISDADIDILNGHTTFNHESPTNRLDAAVRRGTDAILLGLDSLFFGCLFAHEQRVASLTVSEWEKVLSDIDRATAQRERIFKNYDYISEYAKCRYDTKIVEASCDNASGKMRLKLVGKSTLPLKLYRFSEDSLRYEFEEVPAFQGEQTVVLGRNTGSR